MGSGKSTLGKKLARILNSPFADLDALIQEKEKKSISEIFAQQGEDHFRSLENKYLKEIFSESKKPAIVSLGGGTVCFHSNLELIKENGILIYVDLPVKSLCERIKKSKTERPLLKNMNDHELETFIESSLAKRSIFYEQAHIRINGLNLTADFLNKVILEYKNQNIL